MPGQFPDNPPIYVGYNIAKFLNSSSDGNYSNVSNWADVVNVPLGRLPLSTETILVSSQNITSDSTGAAYSTGCASAYFTSCQLGVNLKVTGLCQFISGSINKYTLTGSASFLSSSYNLGTITGNATFSYLTASSGNVVDTTFFGCGTVLGNCLDSNGATITSWSFQNTDLEGTINCSSITAVNFYLSSKNVGSVYPTAYFYDSSSNANLVANNAYFYSLSIDSAGGSVGGDGYFYSTNTQSGTTSGNAYFYYPAINPTSETVYGTIFYYGYPGSPNAITNISLNPSTIGATVTTPLNTSTVRTTVTTPLNTSTVGTTISVVLSA